MNYNTYLVKSNNNNTIITNKVNFRTRVPKQAMRTVYLLQLIKLVTMEISEWLKLLYVSYCMFYKYINLINAHLRVAIFSFVVLV